MRRYDHIANREEYADMNSPDELMMCEEESSGHEKSKAFPVLSKIIFPLIDFASEHPSEWKVLKITIKNPQLSFREIAREAGVSHPLVIRYLRNASKAIPGLKAVLNR